MIQAQLSVCTPRGTPKVSKCMAIPSTLSKKCQSGQARSQAHCLSLHPVLRSGQAASTATPWNSYSYDEMARQVSVAAASSLPLFSSAPAASSGL